MSEPWENITILTINVPFNEKQYDFLVRQFGYDLDLVESYLVKLLKEALQDVKQ